MKRLLVLGIVAVLFASSASGQDSKKPATPNSSKAEQETRYLAFQIFTYGPNPLIASMGEGKNPQPARFPDQATLRDYIKDIKRRIGTVGNPQTRLAVMLGLLSFDHGDDETTKFIELGFDLALETDVAVGFHIDDSMFWAERKDLWSDPSNVEAMDWEGTPCTGRLLNWGKEPSAAPPQMCFNSKVIQREVRQRSALLGKAIRAGVNRIQQLHRPELFAGVIAGSETQIGQDFKTGKYLGYRALLNRGFSREHPPKDLDLERESVVQEFIELWTTGLAEAGVSPQKIYSHICFLSRRAFGLGHSKEITYMQRNKEAAYSQHIHFTPPSVAFGNHHRPGFSTYPQPGLFDDIYEQLAKHKQVGWASCEGTNMQPESGPGQSGMNMETYLAKMFNHGGTLVTIYSWGVGGEANKNMGFRVVTEGEEALRAYRKFLKGEPLIEGETVASLTERLPPEIHQIQRELPAWLEKADAGNKEQASALMKKMQEQLKAKNFEEVEKIADSILKMMGVSTQDSAQDGDSKPQQAPPTSSPSNDAKPRLTEKVERVRAGAQKWAARGRDPSDIAKTMVEQFKPLMETGKVVEAEAVLDRVLEQLTEGTSTPPAAPAIPQEASSYEERLPPKIHRIQKELPTWIEKPGNKEKAAAFMRKLKEQLDAMNFAEAEKTADSILDTIGTSAPATARSSAPSAAQDIPEEVRSKLSHNLGSSFLLFRDTVQGELKVTKEQKVKLDQHLRKLLPDAMRVLQRSKGEREKYNQKAHEERAAVLKEILNEGQRTRLHQLELQKDGLFGPAWNMKELQITDEQQEQFMAPTQKTHQKIQALMEEIHKGANPAEIRPKVLQLRLDLEAQLETLLTDAQEKQWKEMLGKPVDLGVLFDGVSSR